MPLMVGAGNFSLPAEPGAHRTEQVLCTRGSKCVDGVRTACGPGHHQAEAGRVECDECTPGRFAKDAQSVDCDECSAGQHVVTHGATICERCERAEYFCPRGSVDQLPVGLGPCLAAFCSVAAEGLC